MFGNGDCAPGFDSQRRLKFFSLHTDFLHQFPRLSPWTFGFFFSFCLFLFLYSLLIPNLPSSFLLLSLEFLCKAGQSKIMVSVLCLCSLSLSLLGPSYRDKTGAARFQWRQGKKNFDQLNIRSTWCRPPVVSFIP